MRGDLEAQTAVDVVLCPPFVSLAPVAAQLRGGRLRLGAQNMYHEEKGAFTGEVSPLMLRGLCTHVILGHSERRQYFGETDSTVNQKVIAALRAGLTPILCVGERLEEREAGRTDELVSGQLKGALQGIVDPDELVLAYEPVWAIGTGRAASGAQAQEVCALLRAEFETLFGPAFSDRLRILYGGSVTAANVGEFVSERDIDGALVGGASLRAQEFVSIVNSTVEVASRK
jgi:triosephosphate isomerase